MGLSLWIVPDAPIARKLELIMKIRQNAPKSSLSKESYPSFHPHITLASLPLPMENDLDAITRSIPKMQTTLKCSFASVDIGSHYYRSVYVAIELTSQLASLHKHVHEVLGIELKTPTFPHMSLCYIEDTDAEVNGEREAYYTALKDGGKMVSENGSANKQVALDCGSSSGVKDWVSYFAGHEIWAVRCEGPVEGWKVLRRLPLSGD